MTRDECNEATCRSSCSDVLKEKLSGQYKRDQFASVPLLPSLPKLKPRPKPFPESSSERVSLCSRCQVFSFLPSIWDLFLGLEGVRNQLITSRLVQCSSSMSATSPQEQLSANRGGSPSQSSGCSSTRSNFTSVWRLTSPICTRVTAGAQHPVAGPCSYPRFRHPLAVARLRMQGRRLTLASTESNLPLLRYWDRGHVWHHRLHCSALSTESVRQTRHLLSGFWNNLDLVDHHR